MSPVTLSFHWFCNGDHSMNLPLAKMRVNEASPGGPPWSVDQPHRGSKQVTGERYLPEDRALKVSVEPPCYVFAMLNDVLNDFSIS